MIYTDIRVTIHLNRKMANDLDYFYSKLFHRRRAYVQLDLCFGSIFVSSHPSYRLQLRHEDFIFEKFIFELYFLYPAVF